MCSASGGHVWFDRCCGGTSTGYRTAQRASHQAGSATHWLYGPWQSASLPSCCVNGLLVPAGGPRHISEGGYRRLCALPRETLRHWRPVSAQVLSLSQPVSSRQEVDPPSPLQRLAATPQMRGVLYSEGVPVRLSDTCSGSQRGNICVSLLHPVPTGLSEC